MFERYTEKARRVIFFARYEASQFGSPYIETEHLLLGLLREDKRLAHLLRLQNSEETIRQKIEQQAGICEKIPTSLDLPLSNESKRVLAYASEEAERFGHKHIGTEHLLLGMLREGSSFAAQLLNHAGVTLEDARFRIAQPPPPVVAAGGPGGVRVKAADLAQIREQVLSFKKFVWLKREWKPLDVLVEAETGNVYFDCARAQDPKFNLVPAGWTKDWCGICGWELNAENPDHTVGYTNGRDWICPRCHDAFFDPNRKPSI